MSHPSLDSRGVSEILGLVFAFGLVVSVIAVVQLAGTPVWTAGDEADHSASVSTDLASLDSQFFRASGVESGGRVAVDSDVSYPERYLVVSPPDSVGTFRVDGADAVTVTGASAVGPEAVFWDGSTRTYATEAIVYEADYAERDEARMVLESGVSYLETDGNPVVHRQSLVRGTTVTLVFFEGDLDGHTTAGDTVALAPVSVRSESLPVYNATDPVRISVPTYLSEDAWVDLMAEEPHARVVSHVASGDHAVVTIELDAGVRYDFRVARLGVGEAVEPDPAAYAIAVEGEDAAVPSGGRETLTVRAFDRYGAPAAGATLTATSPTPLGGTVAPVDGATAVTDESGRASFTYTAPAGVTEIEHDTVTVALDGASGPGATVSIPLEVRGMGETYEVRNTTPSTPEPEDDFSIDDGEVVPSNAFTGEFELLGSAIRDGWGDVPVSVTFVADRESHHPRDWNNVNDRRSHSFTLSGDDGDGLSIVATARGYVRADSTVDHRQVAVLRDGDPVPAIRGYNGQDDVAEFVAPYISADGRTMSLADNQAIFLFELGTTDPRSNAFDMQDVVILVTLWEDEEGDD
ncbi:Ig-like domain-containing protein [Haloferax sp. KTX1]|uniref:Ig-like domain-containing protein n=1 Tax=Haloferax sp. KTX1 TaxID=2600597 RepID=UPI0011DCA5DF|nr:Ig-like domain-containing protein [Haloferax sp. KTX1]